MSNRISDSVIASAEDAIEEAVARVNGGEANAGVVLAYSVKRTRKGFIVGEFTLRHVRVEKGTFSAAVHPALPFTEEEEEASLEQPGMMAAAAAGSGSARVR